MSSDSHPLAFGDTWQAQHNLRNQPAKLSAARASKQPTALFKALLKFGFNHIDPIDFEALVRQAFEAFGFVAKLTPTSGDDGIDIVLTGPRGTTSIVQCKRYTADQSITPREVREFLGSMTYLRATHGYFVTTSRYSAQSKLFCKEHKILLVDELNIKEMFLLAETVSLNNTELDKSLLDPDTYVFSKLAQTCATTD